MDLFPYNTFQVSVTAKNFRVVNNAKEIPTEPCLILGQGANVLFTKNIDQLVVKNEIRGRKIVGEDADSVTIELGSGENWIELVNWTVENGWSGIENLAFIPGTIGAALTGNIAAYGQNFEDVFVEAQSHDQKFSKEDCQLAYRDSIFKHAKKDIFITSVTIKLSKKSAMDTAYHSRYESLLSYLPSHPNTPYTPKEIAEAVTKIRLDKLPDWRKIGTAGSFFKNPIVKKEKATALQKEIAELQTYPAEKLIYSDATTGEYLKIPAGRLLDELGWKGKKIGRVGTWPKHALTIINLGGASGQEILNFTRLIQADVKKHFDIDLAPEVIII